MKGLLKSLGYGALNLCTAGRGVRRVVGEEPIHFPARWCRYYPADYEPATFAFVRAHWRPGDTVLDIGAHIGLFSVLMARKVGPSGRVFSFEPADTTRKALAETVRLNSCDHIVEIRAEAVAQITCTMTFYGTGGPISNASSLVATERTRTSGTVAAVSIDDFVRTRNLFIHCMKIDIEGAELKALRGAKQTLKSWHPFVHLALHPHVLRHAGDSLAEVWDIVNECGMVVTHNARPVDARWFCEQAELFDVQLVPQT